MTATPAPSHASETLVQALADLLAEVADDSPRPVATDGDDSIRRIGLPSLVLMEYMLVIEERFGFEWDDDVDPEVFRSFDALAAHVQSSRSS